MFIVLSLTSGQLLVLYISTLVKDQYSIVSPKAIIVHDNIIFEVNFSCEGVQFCSEDISTYAHFLSVALSVKLCLGCFTECLEIG